MAVDEFSKKLQRARKAVEDYKTEKLGKTNAPSESPSVQNLYNEPNQPNIEAKTSGACSICPYCGGRGKI